MKLSVIFPIHNPQEYPLLRCLNSIQYQSLKDYELIVVNYGSEECFDQLIENSFSVFKNHEYEKIRNGNLGYARNIGLQMADSEYVVFIDQDDYYDYRYFKFASDFCDLHKLDLCIFDYFERIESTISSVSLLGLYTFNKSACLAISDNHLFNKIFRLDFLRNSGVRFPEDGSSCEELVVLPQWMMKAENVGYAPALFYHHTLHEDSNCPRADEKRRAADIYRACEMLLTLQKDNPEYSEYLQSRILMYFDDMLNKVIKSKDLKSYYSCEMETTFPQLKSHDKKSIFYTTHKNKLAAREYVLCTDKLYVKHPIDISVITVSKNSEKTIQRTINSVLDQHLDNFEYIIIDGTSTDGTVDIIKSYQSGNSNIRYISEADDGIYDAMNKGIHMSHGEIIAILNSDDWYNENALRKVVDQFKNDISLDVLYGNIDVMDESGNFFYVEDAKHQDLDVYMLPHPAIFIRKRVYDIIGHFDICKRLVADYDLLCRIFIGNFHFAKSQEFFTCFRLNGFTSKHIDLTMNEVDSVRLLHFGEKFICESHRNLFSIHKNCQTYYSAANSMENHCQKELSGELSAQSIFNPLLILLAKLKAFFKICSQNT